MSATTKPGAEVSKPREQWSGQFGFIISAIGSAVGLGNIWRFPGVAYENGGGAFLIPYVIALLTAGIPILFLDYAIGHRFRGSAPLAFRRIARWAESLGWFQVMICFFIALYYAAVLAWALSFFVFSFDLKWGGDTQNFFINEYLHTGDPQLVGSVVPGLLIPLVVVWVATLLVLGLGIAKGVQRINFIFMPLLVIAFVILVVRSLFLDGAGIGLDALFTPNFAALSDPNVWIAAYSQIFFSLSIAFGIMITYSSYRRRKANLTAPALVVGFANSSFEILAGIGVFATLGFFAHEQGVAFSQLEGLSGPTLSFITFPAVISQMPGGQLFGVLFFSSLAAAGFTSMISILQVVSSGFQDKFGLKPWQASLSVGGVCALISVMMFSSTTALLTLDTIDQWINNLGIVFSAIAMMVIVLWATRRGNELRYHLSVLSTMKVGRWWLFLVGGLVPLVLGWMFISKVITLVADGYEGLPGNFLMVYGWGTIALAIVGAISWTALRWRRDPDDFQAWPPYTPGVFSSRRKPRAAAADSALPTHDLKAIDNDGGKESLS